MKKHGLLLVALLFGLFIIEAVLYSNSSQLKNCCTMTADTLDNAGGGDGPPVIIPPNPPWDDKTTKP